MTCAAAGEAIQPAKSGRIHTFIATSTIHMQHKLRMTRTKWRTRGECGEVGAGIYRQCRIFRRGCGAVGMDFLVRVFDAVIQAGAKTLNVLTRWVIPFPLVGRTHQAI